MLHTEETEASTTPEQPEHRQIEYISATKSKNTRTTYQSALRQFEKWGGHLPTTPDIIKAYLLEQAKRISPRTLDIHLSAISYFHEQHHPDHPNPTRDVSVRDIMEGIRRVHGRPKRKAKALGLNHIAKMIKWQNKQPDSIKKRRDVALLLVGFFGAFRRSELVAITIEDISWEPEGILIRLPRSKTDQTGAGIYRAIAKGSGAACPVAALKAWLSASHIRTGPIFRAVNRWGGVSEKALNPTAVNDLLKKWGKSCKFDFTLQLSSHSLRRGLSTSAARRNLSFELIKRQGGWKSDATVREYIEEGRHFEDNVSSILTRDLNRIVNSDEDIEAQSRADRITVLRQKWRASEKARKRYAAAYRQERKVNKALAEKVVELELEIRKLQERLSSQEATWSIPIHRERITPDFSVFSTGNPDDRGYVSAMVHKLDKIETSLSEKLARLISHLESPPSAPTTS